MLKIAFVASHAALPSEVYWKTVLPNTPMPQSIKDSLPSESFNDNKWGTSVGVGGGGVGVDVGSQKGGTGVGIDVGGGGTNVNVRHGGGSSSVSGTYHGHPIYIGASPSAQPFLYNYAATNDQLHDNPNVALFFLEKTLTPGQNMNLQFTKTSNKATFLPRKIADTIPFSSNKMNQILSKFSLNPNSLEAQTMKKTITECEEPAIKGEEKLCATSLESMVDFCTSNLGKNVEAISTTTMEKVTKQQQYKITGVVKMKGKKSVACHKLNYAYAVFYCHKTQTTKAYMVNLVGEDGTKVKAAAVCHQDTSAWNPKHLAFKVLNVKPGSVPVCHFLPEDHVVWAAN